MASARCLAIVTARKGSKGLPGKNIRVLCGKPLVVWSIEAALSAKQVSQTIVSTDDPELARLAVATGAQVPFLRPDHLASDEASSVDVVLHALDALEARSEFFDIVVLLEPTSPLREAADIDCAIKKMNRTGASAAVSVCEVGSAHPAFLFRQDKERFLKPYFEQPPNGLRRQDVDKAYFLDGSVYVSTVSALRKRRSFYTENTLAYEMPKWKSPEIDDLDDFRIVEALMGLRGLDP